MTNNATCKQFISFLLGLFLIVPVCRAQHHKMTPQAEQHIYLAMMDTMMAKMDTAQLTGYVESDFLIQMILHHEGAIAMAQHEIYRGAAPEMIQLAKSILVEQKSEINQMRLWLQAPAETRTATTMAYSTAMSETMHTMMVNMPSGQTFRNNDIAFASIMIPHHQGAIDMAKLLIQYSGDPRMNAFARHLISAEQVEIEQMSAFIKQ